MRTLTTLLAAASLVGVLALSAFAAPVAPAYHPAKPPSHPAPAAKTIVTQQGTIKSIAVPKQAGHLVMATLTIQKTTVVVALSPKSYLDKINLTLKKGDAVSITGWMVNKHHKSILVARELNLGEQTFKLRSEDGKPLWEKLKGVNQPK